MSRQQIQISITDAIVIPSLVASIPENVDKGPTALIKVRVFVENP
jgi:hypothetical protein